MTDDIAGDKPARNSKRNVRKEQFAPLPLRAMGDRRLTARHFRVLMAIAFHDRFNRNGQGCWAGRDKLAALAQCSVTHFSDAISDLRGWGYVISTPHPLNRRQVVHRITYDQTAAEHSANDRSQIRDALNDDRSRFQPEQVPFENAKSLNGNETRTKNIFYRNIIDSEKSVEDLKRDCAEARMAEKEKTEIENSEHYLSEVESCVAAGTPLIGEHPKLSLIAADNRLPLPLRERAARLRDMAA